MISSKQLLLGTMLIVCGVQSLLAQEKVWKHGTLAPKGDAGIIYMAAEKGFGKSAGVAIEMIALKGDAMLTKALMAGEIDSYDGNPGGPMIAASKGADIKIIGCWWTTLPYAIFTKLEVKTLADLKGKAIAVSDPGSLPDLFARAAIRSAGLDPNKDVQYVRAGGDADRMKALFAGVVAAAPSSSEFVARAPQMGLKMLVHAKNVTPDYIRFCTMTTSKVLATKRSTAVAFMSAQMKALAYAMENQDETTALAHKLTNAKSDDPNAKAIFIEAKTDKMIDVSMGIDVKKLIYMRDLLADSGMISKSFNPATIIDTSVSIEAAK